MRKGAVAGRALAVFAYAFSASALLCALAWAGSGPRLLLWLLPPAALCVLLAGRAVPGCLPPLLLGLLAGCLCFVFWKLSVLNRAEAMTGESRRVEAVVLEYPVPGSYGDSVEVRVNGVRCRLYLDGESGLVPGERIALEAHFSLTHEKTGEDYYLSLGLPLFGYGDSEPELLGEARAAWRFFPAKLGERLRENLRTAADPETAAFLTAILTGERSALKEDTFFYAMMREAGVLHCIAVSGMHLSFLVSFLAVLLGRGKRSSLICIPVILLFMAVTGFTPSVVRAGVMQLVICFSVLLDREYDSPTALAAALLVLTAANPFAGRNVGLLLSFAATLGILLFCGELDAGLFHLPPRQERRFPGSLLRYARNSLSVSLSAQVLTLPISALAFGQIPLLAPLTNLLILWAVTLGFGLGLAVSILGFFWPWGAGALALPAGLLVKVIAFVVKGIGRLPFASLYPSNRMIALWLLLFYGLLLYFRFRPGLRRRLRPCLLASAVSLLACVLLGTLLYRQDTLLAGFVDVGQGQCVVLCGKDFTLVSDCGSLTSSENAGDLAARYLLSRGRTSVDALILSHYDGDHRNGAEELMRRMLVGRLYVPPPGEDPAALELLQRAEALGVSVAVVDGETQELRIGSLRGSITPPLGIGGANEEGLCALLTVEDFDVLLTGDASAKTELRLLEQLELPDVELLAVGHHGSRNSSSSTFLETAAADVAVISVGRNRYGLPSEDTLRRLVSAGAAVYRTDRCGTVEVVFQSREGGSHHG